MRVKVLFFGALREIAGTAEETAEVPEGASLGTLFSDYRRRFPRLDAMASSIVLARNEEFATPAAALADGDEVAFLPPVSGGSQTCSLAELTRRPIDTEALKRRVRRDEDGALVVFDGVARNNTKGRPTRFLEYEAYEPMALRELEKLAAEIAAREGVGNVAIVHRLGRLEIGEASVVIAVSAPHRRAAFEAALEAINRLKRTVPIWKKEYFEDGEVWVEGEWDASLLRP